MKAGTQATSRSLRQALTLAVTAGILDSARRRVGASADVNLPLTLTGLTIRVRQMARRDPLGALASLVGGASVLFFWAERGKNPKVKTMNDAVLFITTCLSVGYADVFAKTEAGKAIASFVMTLGPAMSSRALDEPVT